MRCIYKIELLDMLELVIMIMVFNKYKCPCLHKDVYKYDGTAV